MAELKVWFEPLVTRREGDPVGYRVSVVLEGKPTGDTLFTDRRMMWTTEKFPWLAEDYPDVPLRW